MPGNSTMLSPIGNSGLDNETHVSIEVQLGPAGAVSGTIMSNGILSVTRGGTAGEYTCVVGKGLLKSLCCVLTTIKAAALVGGKAVAAVVKTDLASDSFAIAFQTGAGVAADVPDNAKLTIFAIGRGA